GREALQALKRASEAGTPFPLVLLDAQMPEFDGFDVAETIRRDPQLAGAVIMMLSSAGQSQDTARCRELGAAAHLTKPIKQSELFNVVRRLRGIPSSAELPPPAAAADLRPEAGDRYHILLAEDNAINQKLAVRLLEKRGHSVTVVNNGLEAVAAIEHERFDLILMDVQMPELNGYEATMEIRERERLDGGHIPIIAMTANAMKGDRERCLESGMDAYVSKPIKPEELFAAIEQGGHRRSRAESQVA
ncbi:MAG TPA: response regulator, partial [Blastocatellia bacterium]|nr:response regulator [Blastocatellia bacterium]